MRYSSIYTRDVCGGEINKVMAVFFICNFCQFEFLFSVSYFKFTSFGHLLILRDFAHLPFSLNSPVLQ